MGEAILEHLFDFFSQTIPRARIGIEEDRGRAAIGGHTRTILHTVQINRMDMYVDDARQDNLPANVDHFFCSLWGETCLERSDLFP